MGMTARPARDLTDLVFQKDVSFYSPLGNPYNVNVPPDCSVPIPIPHPSCHP